jgi:soluble lytic murein transglycosylase-like protein
LQLAFKLAIASAALAVAATPPSVWAGERVHLANGFDMRCDHHAEIGSVVRIYMSKGEGSFIEMKPAEITGYEMVADSPPAAVETASLTPRAETKLTPADLRLMLADAGEQHNLDADLLASVVKAESNGNAHAVSHAGARGLMQLMPRTAADLGVDDSFAPDQNVRGGSAYLDELLRRYHDNIAIALAAYNAGPAAVDKYHGIPPYRETRAYVARVIHEFNRRVVARQHGAVHHAEAARQHQRASQSPAASSSLQASSSR